MEHTLIWIAVGAAFLWLAWLALRVNRICDAIEILGDVIDRNRAHVSERLGYEEDVKWLNENLITPEHRNLGPIFPRVRSIESRLRFAEEEIRFLSDEWEGRKRTG